MPGAAGKMGRPVTIDSVETVGIRVGGAMAHDLNWLAKSWDCSVSDVVRRMIGHEIDMIGLSTPELQSSRRRRSADLGKKND